MTDDLAGKRRWRSVGGVSGCCHTPLCCLRTPKPLVKKKKVSSETATDNTKRK